MRQFSLDGTVDDFADDLEIHRHQIYDCQSITLAQIRRIDDHGVSVRQTILHTFVNFRENSLLATRNLERTIDFFAQSVRRYNFIRAAVTPRMSRLTGPARAYEQHQLLSATRPLPECVLVER